MPRTDLPSAQILVVDDETAHAEMMAEALKRLGHVCTVVHGLSAAADELRHGAFSLVVSDLKMPADGGDEAGLAVLALAKEHQAGAETIIVTAHGDVPTAKQAIRAGAYDFIEKPLDLEVFRNLCTRALEKVTLQGTNRELARRVEDKFAVGGIVGQSPLLREVVGRLQILAPVELPVLILGESGTGKELVAQAMHQQSRRKAGRFVALNCAGLSESILEDELFGHVRGAFTGADKERQGRFEYADGGTLFLDEVGDMPPSMQAKLLRVLESGEVVRVGDNAPRHVSVRVVSATHRDLKKMVEAGTFRQDLYFRLAGATLRLPPLRERTEDIPLLARHFLAEFAGGPTGGPAGALAGGAKGRPAPTLSDDALRWLARYSWPGNVRQLRSVIQSALVLCDGQTIQPRDLPEEVTGEHAGAAAPLVRGGAASMDALEKEAIRQALAAAGGNREAAAATLGIGERTLYRKLKEYGLK